MVAVMVFVLNEYTVPNMGTTPSHVQSSAGTPSRGIRHIISSFILDQVLERFADQVEST